MIPLHRIIAACNRQVPGLLPEGLRPEQSGDRWVFKLSGPSRYSAEWPINELYARAIVEAALWRHNVMSEYKSALWFSGKRGWAAFAEPDEPTPDSGELHYFADDLAAALMFAFGIEVGQ